MAAVAPIKATTICNYGLITDSATVADNVTFSPEAKTNGVMRYVDRSGGIALGYPSITMSVRPPVKGSRMYKVVAVINKPKLETTSASTSTGIEPQPTLSYALQCKLEFMLPERSTDVERDEFLSLVVSLLSTQITASDGTPTVATASPLITAVVDFENVWG